MRNIPDTFFGILDQPFRWPKKGDRLLRKIDTFDEGFRFSKDPIARHAHIWEGYMNAGDALVEDCRKNPQARHFLIYPILFVYRHGIELALKWMLTMYGGRHIDEISHHDLWQLWKLFREVADTSGGDISATAIVQKIVKEMHDLDKSALAFRYGADNNYRAPKLPDGLFDLENIRDVMAGVANYFKGTDGLLSS